MGTMDEDIAEQERLTSAITKLLTKYDPASVGPGRFSDDAEYESEAREIANWIRQEANPARRDQRLLINGIREILQLSFGVECHRIEEVAAEIQNEM